MPEGDTLHRTARTLRLALEGAYVRHAGGSVFADRPAALEGQRIEAVEAQGKHLLITFDDGRVLHTHLGMEGAWHVYRPGERWRGPAHFVRVVLETERFCAVCFRAPVAELLSKRAARARLSGLGPDLLAAGFDPLEAQKRLRQLGRLTIAEALLRQDAMAGVGNIYKSELLFLDRLDPRLHVDAVDDATLASLVARARALLASNARATAEPDGRLEFTHLARTTRFGLTGGHYWVYGRVHRPCFRCRTPIERIYQGVAPRSTYFCPVCQSSDRGVAVHGVP